jgi:arabinose-5-phosphate isomerase
MKARPKAAKAAGSVAAARRVLRIEADAIGELIERLDEKFERAVEMILSCNGRVVVTGLGKSGLIGRKISATLASTGTPSVFLHAADALHGDLGILMREDVVLAISQSGETEELLALLEPIKRLGIKLVTMTGNARSTLASASDVALSIAVKEEACSLNLAPTASTTAALAMGDALAIALLERRGFREEDFAALHPKGSLGSKLRRVESVMHTGDAIPRVEPDATIAEVAYEISRKKLGMTTVTDERGKSATAGRLLGIVTDGDLRRLMEKRKKEALDLTAAEAMTKNPVTLERTELAASALRLMEEKKITSVVIVDAARRVEGVVHLHDLWTLQLF